MKGPVETSDVAPCKMCGAGVQDVVDYFGKISVPALNTKFLGVTERIGKVYERRRACGDTR